MKIKSQHFKLKRSEIIFIKSYAADTKNFVIEHGWGVDRNRNGENDYYEKSIYIDRKWHPDIKPIKKNADINKNFDAYAKLFY